MKAVLAVKRIEFPFIHDLGVLRDLCREAGAPRPNEIGDVAELTPYATGLRYDDNELAAELVDRETALHWATYAVSWAQGIVEEAEESARRPKGPGPGQTSPSST